MKIANTSGDWWFKALVSTAYGFELSKGYFGSKQAAISVYPTSGVIWPVEVFENGSVYVPSEDELK